jgi:hypothetical protein
MMSFVGYVRRITKQGPAAVAEEVRNIPWPDSRALFVTMMLSACKTALSALTSLACDLACMAVPAAGFLVGMAVLVILFQLIGLP